MDRLNDRFRLLLIVMSTTNPKRALFAEFAVVAKALAHGSRMELVELIAQGEVSVDILAQRCGLSVANASQHLQQLRRAGLIVARRENKFVLYRLADDSVLLAVAALRRAAENNLAEVDRIVRSYFQERDNLEAISFDELATRMARGLVTVIDVRPEDEYAKGHVSGAMNIPLSQLRKRLSEFPARKEVIAYCRGPWCVLAFEAVALLREHGRKARRLDGGLPEWKLAGRPVATV
jgi:rhodanese-related sulfurtransferase/DNA-binding transcriptional ArsR family regulator